MADDDLETLADQSADKYHIPRGWFRSLIGRGEGGFRNPTGVSPEGARGVGQLMPETAREMGVTDVNDPSQNLDGAARYAGQMWRKYKGDARLASAAYNAGPGAVDKARGVPRIAETQGYVKRVGLPTTDDLLDAKPLPTTDDLLGGPEKPAARPTPLQKAQAQPDTRPGHESFGDLYRARAQQAAAPIQERLRQATSANPRDMIQNAVRQSNPIVSAAADVGGEVGAGLSTMIDYALGRPVEAATGGRVKAQTASDYAGAALPVVGEVLGEAGLASRAGRLGVAADTLRANEAARARLPAVRPQEAASRPSTEHQAAVQRLRVAGVEPAKHQAAGGAMKRFTEAASSDFHVGPGIRAAESQATDSFNRALYNKVLAPLGESVLRKAPVGREAVAAVGNRVSAAYDRVLPHIRVGDDQQLTTDLADVRTSVARLGKPQEGQYEAILNQDVLHHFGLGGMDGPTFKSVESDLLRQSRNLKGSPDPNVRALGGALDDTLDALRSAMERSSPPKWRARIRDVNEAQAMLVRLEDAASRRQGGRGRITPGDLLAAVKKSDTRVRKRGFGRGEALLQQFAEDADRVLTREVPDSGTPERAIAAGVLGHTIGGELGGMALGLPPAFGAGLDIASAPATNFLAKTMLSGGRAARVARMRGPNYLSRIDQRVLR